MLEFPAIGIGRFDRRQRGSERGSKDSIMLNGSINMRLLLSVS